jgi:hypothetical protein
MFPYKTFLPLAVYLSWVVGLTQAAFADEQVDELQPTTLRRSIERAIPMLEAGAAGSANERQCYTCHSQGLPVLALTAAAARGLPIAQAILQQQVEHTWNHLQRGQAGYLEGKGQGGQTMTAGYALWTLETAGRSADQVTEAVAHYLLKRHADKSHWLGGGQRPPSSGSSFTATYLALRGLSTYGISSQEPELATRRDSAAKWLLNTQPKDTEDRVFQLLSLPYIEAQATTTEHLAHELLAQQLPDGGWAQSADMHSDAYATGSVLYALHAVAKLDRTHPAMLRGYQFLIETQLPDGTWHVATRAKPIQDYFESGFPHGDDQFISIAATGWAVLALVQALPANNIQTLIAAETTPRLTVRHCNDFEVTGLGDAAAWQTTHWVPLQRRPKGVHDYTAQFKMLYSDQGVYVLFDGSDQRLTATLQEDFLDLWTEDVYECFFWTDESQPLYFEYEISPLGFELPILIPNLGGKFLGWRPWHYEGNRKIRKQVSARGGPSASGAAVTGWRAEVFIPFDLLKPLQNVPPKSGSEWRANFYRVDYDPLPAAAQSAPAPNQPTPATTPTTVTQWDWSRVGPSFHEYQKFGTLVFE